MTNPSQDTSGSEQGHWFKKPYAERRILAGFLNTGEIDRVYSDFQGWPPDVNDYVARLYGAANSLSSRPEAGVCEIENVSEPDALTQLDPIARGIALPLSGPCSYNWVKIQHLIAASAVAASIHPRVLPSNENVQSLANYSLYAPVSEPLFLSPTLIATDAPLDLRPIQAVLQNSRLTVHYQVSRTASPIIVGYENGRCYLLSGYGRVIAALATGIDRLLCLTYFGLDLMQPSFGIRLQGPLNLQKVNHFGSDRLTSSAPPLVRDFLDLTLTAVVPARASLFLCEPAMQMTAIQFESGAPGPLPLTGQIEANVSE